MWEVLRWIGSPDTLEATHRLLATMADDPVNTPGVLGWLRGGHVELRSILRALSRAILPRNYLEIGVRRGWGLAQVAAEASSCNILGCDLWVPHYGGVENPGAGWVREELRRTVPGFRGRLDLHTGDSRAAEFAEHIAGRAFDLICVDGDHSGEGALADLRLCLPLLVPGGALVFDDLLPISDGGSGFLTLRDAWETVKAEFPGYAWIEYEGLVPIGIAVRGNREAMGEYPTWLSFGPQTEHPGALRGDILPVADAVVDIQDMLFASNQFAGIEAFAVLEHLHRDDAPRAVRECYRVLQPGGIFEASVHDMERCAQTLLSGNLEILLSIYSPAREAPLRHQWGYTRGTLPALLEREGFTALEWLPHHPLDSHELRIRGRKPR